MQTLFSMITLFLIWSPSLWAAPDIDVNKTVDLPFVEQGETVEYTITVTNNGDTQATGLQITDQLPANTVYISDDEPDEKYDAASGIWDIGQLAINEQVILKVIAIIKDD
jgi:uncharacterized repeat protein (TIGR01451 family)